MRTNLNLGFSLIELMVVISIISVLAGLALPRYQTMIERANYPIALNKIDVEAMNRILSQMMVNSQSALSIPGFQTEDFHIGLDIDQSSTVTAADVTAIDNWFSSASCPTVIVNNARHINLNTAEGYRIMGPRLCKITTDDGFELEKSCSVKPESGVITQKDYLIVRSFIYYNLKEKCGLSWKELH